MEARDRPEPERPRRRPDRPARNPWPRRVTIGSVRRGGMLGLSSTRRAVALALVVCALALSIAVPLRNYIGQRGELADVEQQQTRLREQVDQLEQRKQELSDPAQVEAEARRRLRYVRPGETPYIVQLPDQSTSAPLPPTKDPGQGTDP
jgi:cell division protein FtsB